MTIESKFEPYWEYLDKIKEGKKVEFSPKVYELITQSQTSLRESLLYKTLANKPQLHYQNVLLDFYQKKTKENMEKWDLLDSEILFELCF